MNLGRHLGTFSLVFLFFAGAASVLSDAIGWFVGANALLGIASLVGFFASGRERLGAFLGERSTRYGANAVAYSLLVIGIVAFANLFGARYHTRFDVTEAKVHSLAPQSVQVVSDLEDEIELLAFVEGGSAPQIEALLRNFADASRNVRYRMVDPDEEPMEAEKYNITAYGTVRVAYGDQATTITGPSEESLTNAIVRITRSERKTLCFVEGHGEPDIDDRESARGYSLLAEALRNDNFETRKVFLALADTDLGECSALVAPAPVKPYLEPEVDRVRTYLRGGGRAVFLFSGPRGDDLGAVLQELGIEVGKDIIVDQVVRLFQGPQLSLDTIASSYGEHPITQGFRERTSFPLSRSVQPAASPAAGITVTTLVNTSESSWAENDVERLFEEQSVTLDPSVDRKGPVSIAVAATIDLSKLDPDQSGESRLAVFGSDEFVNNKFLSSFFNRDLFLNSANWVTGEESLISIRPRRIRSSIAQLTADEQTAIFQLSVLVLPELLLLVGIAVWANRRSA